MKFSEVIQSSEPVLIDFHATWCGPCQMMPPILKEVKSKFGDQIKILKIDVDKNQALANKLNVRGVPTLMLYKEGEVKWRQSGVIQANDIAKVIESNQ